MSQIAQKLCRVCGKDVANQKRTKDAAGNYYCAECYASERQRAAQSSPVTVATPSPSDPNASVETSTPNPLGRKARWFAAIAAISLCVMFIDVGVFATGIGGKSDSVMIPVVASFWLSFFVLAFTAMWFARNWRKIFKERRQPLFGRFTRPLAIVGKVLVLVMVLLGVVSMFLGPSDKRATSNTSADTASSELPAIHIDDRDGEAKFSDWRVEGYNLVGTLVVSGPYKIDTLTYTTKRNGIVKHRGDVKVPGDYFTKGEKVEATILLWEDPKGLDVTIEVVY